MKTRRAAYWGRILRRGAALGMALTVVWGVSLTADLDAAGRALKELGTRPELAELALRLELGEPPEEGLLAEMGLWRLVVDQSALLRGGRTALADPAAGQDDPPPAAEPEPDDGEDPEHLPDRTAGADDVVARTMGVSPSQTYDSGDGVYIYNRTDKTVSVAAMSVRPLELTLPEEGPQILIMHTHGSEAYTPAGTDVYEASDPYRTTDDRYNMIRVGEEMAAVFEAAGFSVLHDTTLYDYPAYSGAYDRSLAGVEALLEEHPSIRVVLDVHRDALTGGDGTVYKTAVEGEDSAQVMLVMGSNDNGLPHDRWEDNLALAVRLQRQMNDDCPTLARPISLRAGRYNQQLTTGSLLVEVGSHGNTLEEALAAARRFAASAAVVLADLKE